MGGMMSFKDDDERRNPVRWHFCYDWKWKWRSVAYCIDLTPRSEGNSIISYTRISMIFYLSTWCSYTSPLYHKTCDNPKKPCEKKWILQDNIKKYYLAEEEESSEGSGKKEKTRCALLHFFLLFVWFGAKTLRRVSSLHSFWLAARAIQ